MDQKELLLHAAATRLLVRAAAPPARYARCGLPHSLTLRPLRGQICESGTVAGTATGGIVLAPPDGLVRRRRPPRAPTAATGPLLTTSPCVAKPRSIAGSPCRGAVSGLCLLDRGAARVAACGDQGSIAVTDLFAGRTVARVEEGVACTSCDAVDTSTLAVACASAKGALRLYDARSGPSGQGLATIAWHGDRRQPWARRLLTALATDPLDASRLAAGTAGGDLLFFDLRALGHGPVGATRVGSPAEGAPAPTPPHLSADGPYPHAHTALTPPAASRTLLLQ